MDGIVHVGRDPDRPTQNRTVISKTWEDVLAASGSRYAPSSPLDCLQDLLGDGRRYAFVGKPCDVAGLHALCETDPAVKENFPILLSFFCAGVPSIKGGATVIDAMGLATEEVRHFDFRGPGWPGQAEAHTYDGKTQRMSYAASWGDILSKHVQHRCKICADGSGMFADLVFADVWEADAAGYPSFEERPGKSLILARTALGRDILEQAGDNIATEPYDLNQLARVQPGQVRRRKAVLARLIGLRLMGRPTPRFRGMGLWRMALRNSLRDNLRNCLGMMRRSWQGRGSRA